MAETWGDVFQAALAKGCDHASAATRANDWERRQRESGAADLRAEISRLRNALTDIYRGAPRMSHAHLTAASALGLIEQDGSIKEG